MPIIKPEAAKAGGRFDLHGWYEAKVVGVRVKSSRAGNPMIVVQFAIPEKDQVVESYYIIWHNGAPVSGLLWACGFQDEANEMQRDRTTPDFELDRLIGCKLQLIFEGGWVQGHKAI